MENKFLGLSFPYYLRISFQFEKIIYSFSQIIITTLKKKKIFFLSLFLKNSTTEMV